MDVLRAKSKYTIAILLILIVCGSIYSCTIAVVGESVAGRPILWKNRDVNNPHQAVRYFDSEPLAFVANIYEGESDRAWSGINEAGFGIVNTDTYNQGICGVSGDDDGVVMFNALGNFITVGDFQTFLDSTNLTIRRTTHCYGVFDSTGAATIFEAGRNYYVRYDANDNPCGYLVRTNYADSGEDTNFVGEDRRIRAESVLEEAVSIEPGLFLYNLARDLFTEELDPYPLPFEGSFGSYPAGIIESHHTINRYYTSSACVLIGGNGEGFPPTMWQFLGQPAVSIPVPIWVNSGEVSPPLGGSGESPLCDMAIEFKSLIYTGTYTVDSYMLDEILDRFQPTEMEIWARVDAFLGPGSVSVPDLDSLGSFQEELIDIVMSKYLEIRSLYIKEGVIGLPQQLRVDVSPNPFNSAVKISFDGGVGARPGTGQVGIEIFDISGRLVADLPVTTCGSPQVVPTPVIWQPEKSLGSGVYLVRARISDYMTATRRVVYLK